MNRLIIFAFVLFSISCNFESDLSVEFENAEEALVINAILSNEKGVEAVVSSSKPLGNRLSSTINRNVLVELVSNFDRVDTLSLQHDSVYRLANFFPKPKVQYQLKVTDTSKQVTCYSLVIDLPQPSLQMTLDTTNLQITGSLTLNVSDFVGSQKYLVYFIEYDENNQMIFETRSINNYEILTFPNTGALLDRVFFRPSTETKTIVAKLLVLNSSLTNYLSSLKLQQSSFEEKYVEPANLKGNIINGFGFFGSYYVSTALFKL